MPHEKIEDGYTGNLVYVCVHTEGLTNFTTTQLNLYIYIILMVYYVLQPISWIRPNTIVSLQYNIVQNVQ